MPGHLYRLVRPEDVARLYWEADVVRVHSLYMAGI